MVRWPVDLLWCELLGESLDRTISGEALPTSCPGLGAKGTLEIDSFCARVMVCSSIATMPPGIGNASKPGPGDSFGPALVLQKWLAMRLPEPCDWRKCLENLSCFDDSWLGNHRGESIKLQDGAQKERPRKSCGNAHEAIFNLTSTR